MSDSQSEILGDQLDLHLVKKRSVAGIIAITSRTFFLQLIALVANFLFGIFLLPEEYGVFYGVSAIIEFFVIFSDVGLAAALIQKKATLDDHDLTTTFTVQQILVNTLALVAFFLSPLIGRFYNLSSAGVWLFRALSISLILASLKTIPSIRLERQLEFPKLVIPQIVENILFYITAVFLAWQGFGVTSFSWAVLVRGLAGLIVIYLLAPWRPAFGLDKIIIRQLFSFGLPFQLNTIIAFVKDKLIIAFLFKVLQA
ncbi:MAG: oligosaccharide flippase family protein, partial [Candidatus Chisholmbacteria bacterium]|nr:oligosaccharide flippase family protein [Candidatus Chisholmbacteria bacterium]